MAFSLRASSVAQLDDRCVLARAGGLRRRDHRLQLLDVGLLERDDAGVRGLEVLVELDELIALAQVVDLVEAAVLIFAR